MSPTKDVSSSTIVLAERSPNTISPKKSAPSDFGKPTFLNDKTTMPIFEPPQLRSTTSQQTQEDRNSTGDGASHTYISPSDAIRSPTTKKLSEIKGKRFMNAKPKTLFAQTVSRENVKAQGQQGK